MFIFLREGDLTPLLLALSIAITGVETVDEAIQLYLTGDMSGTVTALEDLLERGNLSLDEEIRAFHRLGAAYYGLGQPQQCRDAFHQVLMLDPYYELGLWENPNLRNLLDQVRQESLATVLVQGEPQGAMVFMNDEYVGTAPYIQDNLIGGRTYTFSIIAEGYEPAVQVCPTQPGQLHTITFAMNPIAAGTQAASSDTSSAGSASVDVAMSGTGDTLPLPADTLSGSQAALQGTGPQTGPGDVLPVTGPDIQPQPPDTSYSSTIVQTGSMTPEELMALLGGGIEMAYLGDVGPLNAGGGGGQEDHGSGLVQPERNPTIFSTISGHIETDTGESRMVFSDVPLSQEDLSPSSGGGGASYSSRTAEEIMEVLADKTSAVTFIYNKHLRADPILSGTVLIELVIEPSGRVSDVNIVDSTTYNPAFDLELASAVETWRFGAVDEDEGPLTVQYPFSFSR